MSAQDHLSPSQFEAFRALPNATKLTEPLGQHWSGERNESYGYLITGIHGREEKPKNKSLVVHAEYKPEDHDPKEWTDADYPVTLKQGSKVKVHGVDVVSHGGVAGALKRVRKRTYNPPREMKA